jgi:hypothetical protein
MYTALRRIIHATVVVLVLHTAVRGVEGQTTITIGSETQDFTIPFNANPASGNIPVYQQVYGSSSFGSRPLQITGITFYGDNVPPGPTGPLIGSIATGNYVFSLSTTTKPVNGLSTVLSNNIGPDNQVFLNQVLSGTGQPGGIMGPLSETFAFTGSPFNYNPAAGNLLLTITSSNVILNGQAGMLAQFTPSGAPFSSAWQNSLGGINVVNNLGLVTTFTVGGSSIVVRTPPYDFFDGCNSSSPVASFGSAAAAVVDSNPLTGTFDVNIQALGLVADAKGQAGVGVIYNSTFTGNVAIQTTVQIPPPSFDLVYATGIPKIGQAGIAGLTSSIFISAIPPVDSIGTQMFSSLLTLPVCLPGVCSTSHMYNPAQQFTFSRTVPVSSGEQLRICAGIQSEAHVTGLPATLTMSKGLYTGAKVLNITITPQ